MNVVSGWLSIYRLNYYNSLYTINNDNNIRDHKQEVAFGITGFQDFVHLLLNN
jgi:hypothetical protein